MSNSSHASVKRSNEHRTTARRARTERVCAPPHPSHDAPKVLLAIGREGGTQACLHRARSMADALGAEVHVVQVLPGAGGSGGLLTTHKPQDVIQALETALAARRATRSWLKRSGAGSLSTRLKLRSGSFVEQVGIRAEELKAVLIVVDDRGPRLGVTASSLARSTQTPVVVARDARPENAIVAATDLRAKEMPLLTKAAKFARTLEAKLIAVHNVPPLQLAMGPEGIWLCALGMGSSPVSERYECLSEAARRKSIEATPIVADETDAARGIERIARAESADLIVVGTRERRWFKHTLRRGVAERMVEQACRSVLVLPLEQPRAKEKR